jgi:hypothetical protein
MQKQKGKYSITTDSRATRGKRDIDHEQRVASQNKRFGYRFASDRPAAASTRRTPI